MCLLLRGLADKQGPLWAHVEGKNEAWDDTRGGIWKSLDIRGWEVSGRSAVSTSPFPHHGRLQGAHLLGR